MNIPHLDKSFSSMRKPKMIHTIKTLAIHKSESRLRCTKTGIARAKKSQQFLLKSHQKPDNTYNPVSNVSFLLEALTEKHAIAHALLQFGHLRYRNSTSRCQSTMAWGRFWRVFKLHKLSHLSGGQVSITYGGNCKRERDHILIWIYRGKKHRIIITLKVLKLLEITESYAILEIQ